VQGAVGEGIEQVGWRPGDGAGVGDGAAEEGGIQSDGTVCGEWHIGEEGVVDGSGGIDFFGFGGTGGENAEAGGGDLAGDAFDGNR
jgi:hypothetical protein